MSAHETADAIIASVCRRYRVTPRDLKGKSREGKFVWPRHVAMCLIYERTNWNRVRVGKVFRRTGWAVSAAINHVWDEVDTDPKRAADFEEMRMSL